MHYDPQTRSFVGYKESAGALTPIELCLDGSLLNPNVPEICRPDTGCTPAVLSPRPRPVGNKLEGAAYDPFTNKWLFLQDLSNAKTLTRIGLDYTDSATATIQSALGLSARFFGAG